MSVFASRYTTRRRSSSRYGHRTQTPIETALSRNSLLVASGQAHKVVLERARYFRALFSGPLAATSSNEVELRYDDPHITSDAVSACIAFLYNNKLPAVGTTTTCELVGVLACASMRWV